MRIEAEMGWTSPYITMSEIMFEPETSLKQVPININRGKHHGEALTNQGILMGKGMEQKSHIAI